MTSTRTVAVFSGQQIGRYGFGDDHPLGENRLHAFWDEMHRRCLDYQVKIFDPVMATDDLLKLFHTTDYLERVKLHSQSGKGWLDYGDTPAYKGIFEDASFVVGTVIDAVYRMMNNEIRRAFVPIAGMHHSRPDTAAGFCVFNDVGVAIRVLEDEFGLERIAYVDIDAHHGDGVFYSLEEDPRVIFADIHEDGRYIYPQSGFSHETGKGAAKGTKLNIPLLPLSADDDFLMMWEKVEDFIKHWEPQFIILNCGADGLRGDPLTHLHYSPRVHAKAAHSLCRIAEEFAKGRILAVGGGGYDLRNLGKAWTAVIDAFLETPMS